MNDLHDAACTNSRREPVAD